MTPRGAWQSGSPDQGGHPLQSVDCPAFLVIGMVPVNRSQAHQDIAAGSTNRGGNMNLSSHFGFPGRQAGNVMIVFRTSFQRE